jgi:hypothetical protein
MSLLYYVLGDSLSKIHTADIGEETKVDKNTTIPKESLYVVHLKRLIWENIKKNYSKKMVPVIWSFGKLIFALRSWKNLIIKENLGESLNPAKKFTNVFPNALEERIQIIVQPPPSAIAGKCLPTFYLSNKNISLFYFYIIY